MNAAVCSAENPKKTGPLNTILAAGLLDGLGGSPGSSPFFFSVGSSALSTLAGVGMVSILAGGLSPEGAPCPKGHPPFLGALAGGAGAVLPGGGIEDRPAGAALGTLLVTASIEVATGAGGGD